MSYVFVKCSSLKEFPDISKWDISNVNNLDGIFIYCSSLEHLPEISSWKTTNIKK